MANIQKALKDAGLVVVEAKRLQALKELAHTFWELRCNDRCPHGQYYGDEEYEQLLKDAGFEIDLDEFFEM